MARAQSVAKARVEDLRAHALTSAAIEIFSPLTEQVGDFVPSPKLACAIDRQSPRSGPAQRRRNRIGRAAGRHRGHPLAVLASNPSEASSRCSLPDGRANRSWGDVALAISFRRSSGETPNGTAARAMPAPEAAFRGVGRGTAAPWRGL